MRRRTPLVVAVAGLGLALTPVRALAARDQAATKAYIHADYRLIHAATSKIPLGEATLHGMLLRVRRECPLVAVRAPHDGQTTELENEVVGAMATTLIALDRSAGKAFVSATRRLRWSDPKLSRTVHRYVQNVRTLLTLPQPSVCSDFESWASSGFMTLPAATLSFTTRFMRAWVVVGNLPSRLVRSATPDEHPLVARTQRLEKTFADSEAREVGTYGDIIRTLGLRV